MTVVYEYVANVISVYDGDTFRCDIDLGFGVELKNQCIRLLGLDTPEVRGVEREAGLEVRDFVRDKILDKTVLLRTHKDDKGKYGRWLAEVFYRHRGVVTASDSTNAMTNLNAELLELGMAEEMDA